VCVCVCVCVCVWLHTDVYIDPDGFTPTLSSSAQYGRGIVEERDRDRQNLGASAQRETTLLRRDVAPVTYSEKLVPYRIYYTASL
jgi:hypothetical protein